MRGFREHGRRASDAAPSQARWRLLVAGVLTAATVPLAVAAALAAPSKPLTIVDATQETSSPLDILSVQISRAKDGRLRAIVTFAASITPKTLLATGGPPGSACLRIWTAPDADPTAIRPDRLVCVTARSGDELRGGVYQQSGPGLPKRIADASARVNKSGRSLIIRASQSALGRPKRILIAVETMGPGCERVSCIDSAPNDGSTRPFRLR
jgi:hypothetical protein